MRASHGTWRWQGISNDIVDDELWNKLYPTEPHGSSINDCGCLSKIYQGAGFVDCTCEQTALYHICERN